MEMPSNLEATTIENSTNSCILLSSLQTESYVKMYAFDQFKIINQTLLF